MSWQVDGVYYHDYEKYQAALARQQASQATRAADAMRQQMSALQQRINEREEALAKARNDLSAHTRATEGLRNDVAEMRRLQAEVERQRRHAQDESQRQIEALRADNAINREALSSLERDHAAHAEATRKAYDSLNRELASGLQEAESRRRESEDRLQDEIDKVETQVRKERETRLAQQVDALARAGEMILFVEQDIQRHANVMGYLGLTEDAEEIGNRLRQARELHHNGDAAASLAISHLAAADARSLDAKVRNRDAELSEARQNVSDTVKYMRDMAADATAERYFNVELSKVKNVMDRLERRASRGYERYDQLAIERVRDQEILNNLRGHILEIIKCAPTARDLDIERVEVMKRVIDRLVAINGPMSVAPKRVLSIPQDRKSEMAITCKFGQSQVRVSVDLDGAVSLDGYGYERDRKSTR